MRRPFAFFVILSLAALPGCAVVDLTAHGIKEYQKQQQQGKAGEAAPSQGGSAQAQAEEPPPPAAASVSPQPVVERESISVEALPPR